jgi:hypothetical protein
VILVQCRAILARRPARAAAHAPLSV